MKKTIIALLASLLVMGTAASAHPYKNEAFWGEWVSKSATAENGVHLYINYIDQNSVEVDFKQIKDGAEPVEFIEYSGSITNADTHIHAALKFYFRENGGDLKPGQMEFDMYEDNIWLTVISDDGRTFFDNQLVSVQQPFNPFGSPFSYDLSVELNGSRQNLSETKPFIVNGTTYVPLRGLLDSMNLNVYWDDTYIRTAKSQFITTTRNDTILQFSRTVTPKGTGQWSLNKWMSDNSDTLSPPSSSIDISNRQPIIKNDRAYVPLRILSEAYGAVVDWDGSTRTVIIKDNIGSDTKKTQKEIEQVQSFTIDKADQAAASYTGMVRYDMTPRYNNRSKYFIYIQDEKRYKLFYDGSVADLTD